MDAVIGSLKIVCRCCVESVCGRCYWEAEDCVQVLCIECVWTLLLGG